MDVIYFRMAQAQAQAQAPAGPLGYEDMAAEDRAVVRARRARLMEDWPHSTPAERLLKRMGKLLTTIQECNEDMRVAIRGIAADNWQRSGVVLTAVARTQAERIGEVLGVAEVDCKYGIGIAEQMNQDTREVVNISDDQAKVLKNILKKKDEEAGGKMKGKATATAASKPYERPDTGMGADMMGSGAMGAGVMGSSVMGGNMMGGGMMGGGMMGPQYMWPQQMAQQMPQQMAYGMMPPPLTQQGMQMQAPMQMHMMPQQMQAAGMGATGMGGTRKRFPCDACNQWDHWKMSPSCPKFITTMEAKLAQARASQGMDGNAGSNNPAAGSSGVLALPGPRQGKENFWIIIM